MIRCSVQSSPCLARCRLVVSQGEYWFSMDPRFGTCLFLLSHKSTTVIIVWLSLYSHLRDGAQLWGPNNYSEKWNKIQFCILVARICRFSCIRPETGTLCALWSVTHGAVKLTPPKIWLILSIHQQRLIECFDCIIPLSLGRIWRGQLKFYSTPTALEQIFFHAGMFISRHQFQLTMLLLNEQRNRLYFMSKFFLLATFLMKYRSIVGH